MSGIMEQTKGVANDMMVKGQNLLDNTFPPEQRANVQSRIQDFASAYPKLFAFVLANVVFSGLPVITFLIFSVSAFVFSLLTALVVGTLFTAAVTLSAIGFGLLFAVPVVFMTSLAAAFTWAWGVGAFYVFQYFNQPQRKEAIRNNVKSLTDSVSNGVNQVGSKLENGSRQVSQKMSEATSKAQSKAGAIKNSATDGNNPFNGSTHQKYSSNNQGLDFGSTDPHAPGSFENPLPHSQPVKVVYKG